MKKMAGFKVKDILTNIPVTVTEETRIDDRHHHGREECAYPASHERRHLVGIIGKKDIIRTLID